MAKTAARKSTIPNSATRKRNTAPTPRTSTTQKAQGTSRSSRTPGTSHRKYVYFFGNGKADGDRTMKDTLGGKGSGLAEMTNADLPVPPGFTISTDVCTIYYKERSKIPAKVDREIDENLKKLEKAAGAQLGS